MSITSQQGFLLTSRWYEGEQTTELEFWFTSQVGPLCVRIEQPSVCFIPTKDQEKALRLAQAEGLELTCRPVELQSFSLEPLVACYLRQQDIYRFNYLLNDWDIVVWEFDIRPTDRYLMERFIRSGAEIQGEWQQCDGFLLCQQGRMKPSIEAIENTDLSMLSVDIETSFPKQGLPDRLFSIALDGEVFITNEAGIRQKQGISQIWMIGDDSSPEAEHCQYIETEQQLLEIFFAEIQRLDPDIIIGWNFIQFDMDFIQRKCDELELPFILGRDQQEVSWRHDKNTNSATRARSYVHVSGRCIIDGIEMLRQAQYQFESFALDNVAEELLGRKKLLSGSFSHKDYNHEIEYLFDHDKPALAAYNLEDCILVLDIFQQTELMDFAIQRSSLTGLLLDRMGGSVASFENLYLPLLHRAGYVAPNYGEGYSDIKSPGGFVMDSRPGLYDSILVLDFKSLYPSIMRTFKIDPMGLIEGLKAEELKAENSAHSDSGIAGFNGGYFDREKHCLPDLITMLGEQRDQAKKDNNHHLAQAIKIIMSSFYGVLGSDGCRFFDMRLSSSITQRSHEIIQRSGEWIKQQGYDVIYGDTDSVFVWLKEKKTQQQADSIGKKLSIDLNSWWRQTIQQEHQLDSKLEIEYETHYQKFFMPSIRGADIGSKKRYAGTVHKILNNGEEEIETVFKGLEAVRTDWTPFARQFQQQLFQRIFSEQAFQQWMKDEVADLMSGNRDQQLIYRKRLRQPLSEYQRNVPPHAKAAAVLELWRQQQGLPPLYEDRGGWIQYLATTSGPQPIEVYQSSQGGLQGGLQIDYQHYFEKQIAPVCDGLLALYDTSFAEICGQQMSLF